MKHPVLTENDAPLSHTLTSPHTHTHTHTHTQVLCSRPSSTRRGGWALCSSPSPTPLSPIDHSWAPCSCPSPTPSFSLIDYCAPPLLQLDNTINETRMFDASNLKEVFNTYHPRAPTQARCTWVYLQHYLSSQDAHRHEHVMQLASCANIFGDVPTSFF